MSLPLLYTLLRKSLVQTLVQVRNILIFAPWNKNKQSTPPSWIRKLLSGDLGTRLGICSESSILLLTSGDVSTLYYYSALYILLLTSGYFSTLYYYSALYILLLIASDFSTLYYLPYTIIWKVRVLYILNVYSTMIIRGQLIWLWSDIFLNLWFRNWNYSKKYTHCTFPLPLL